MTGGALADQAARLGHAFAQRTVSDLATLRELLAAARAEGAEQPLVRLARIAHGIHGAGATFGFQSVSDRAGELESRLKQALANGAERGEALFDALEQLIARLEAALPR